MIKKITSILFHRAGVALFGLLLQIGLLALVLVRFRDNFILFYWIGLLISTMAVLWIVSKQGEPAYKIAWIIPILIIPVFGGIIYLLFGGNHLSANERRKMKGMDETMQAVLRKDYGTRALEYTVSADAANQARYLEQIAHCPVYQDTRAEYLSQGEIYFRRLVEELERAERYIFMEYFIIEEGEMWNTILDVLTRKATQGVDVRVIYDDIGCMFTLPRHYERRMQELGIACCVFNPFTSTLSPRMNNRDHRKICVVDGKIGFTGGVNLADEYINAVEKHGHWKDVGILLDGAAVWSMAVMFLTLWDFTNGTKTDYELFRAPIPAPSADFGQSFVQPYTDSPLDGEAVCQTVYLNMIGRAKKYVYIMTPYLIIDSSMNTALINAAKQGVDVRIMTPHVPDKKAVFEVTRSHYGALLQAGVRIFEYTPGFVHAKTYAVDDCYGVVGTINMDYRSLFLHFENGVWLCNDPVVRAIRDDFLETQTLCQEVEYHQWQRQPWHKKLMRSVLQVFAPLL